MRIVDFSLKRRVTVSMAAVALILFGAVAFTRLSVNLMPDLSYPSVTVETRLDGAAPAEVEALRRVAGPGADRDAILAEGDRLDRRSVGDHGEHEVGGCCGLPWGIAPHHALGYQRISL